MEETPPQVDKPSKVIPWGQDRRLQFIDFRLRWSGQLNRTDLTEYFGISVPQASLDVSLYSSLTPENLHYDRGSKAYLTGQHFRPLYSRTSAKRFLAELLATEVGIMDSGASFIGHGPACAIAPSPERSLDDETVVRVVKAILNRQKLFVQYQSMSSPEPGQRWLSPHALGYDGFRWHMRAYCHKREDFYDFVLARILDISAFEGTEIDPAQDTLWHRVVDLVLAPHPALAGGKRRVIELDYGMVDGQVHLACRQALLYYTLKRLGLLKTDVADANEQQIILANREQVQPLIDEALAR
ncbi:WYL domain-containing protein [Massilia sp. SR12]